MSSSAEAEVSSEAAFTRSRESLGASAINAGRQRTIAKTHH